MTSFKFKRKIVNQLERDISYRSHAPTASGNTVGTDYSNSSAIGIDWPVRCATSTTLAVPTRHDQ
jgi:hypothetical protein